MLDYFYKVKKYFYLMENHYNITLLLLLFSALLHPIVKIFNTLNTPLTLR